VNWSDRVPKTANNYNYQVPLLNGDGSAGTGAGVAYEWQIDLCNKATTDMWVNIPHKASDDFVRQLARLIRDNLNSQQKVYVEYSNEVWNWGFHQTVYADQQGQAKGFVGEFPFKGKTVYINAWWGYYVYRSCQIARIFEQEFAGQTQRLRKVLGTQLGYDNWPDFVATWGDIHPPTLQLMAALAQPAINPNNVVFDTYAVAPYWNGNDLTSMQADIANIEDKLGEVQRALNDHGNGIKLICYEGGQDGGNQVANAQNPGIYNVYIDALNRIGARLQGPFVHYTHVGWDGNYAWGAKQSTSATLSASHKYRAIVDWVNAHGGAPAPPPPPVTGNKVNHIGINIDGSCLDYNTDKPFADAMRSHRSSYFNVPRDANYWATQDAQYLVWAGLNTHNNQGTYKLSFKGQADISLSGQGASYTNKSYNAATNVTTADVIISDPNNDQLWITFTNTRRTPSGGTNTGVTDIKLMRPVAPGSTQSYPEDRVYTDYFLAALAPFEAIRFMDWTATNTCGDSLWSDRTLWTHASQNPPNLPNRTYGWQGRGGSWESVIMLCNLTGKDAWINIPHKATDDYITQLARLFRDGNEHTPGLRSDLHLYVEYSNEVWNWAGAFAQTPWVRDKGKSYGQPLNFDGETDDFTLGLRYKALRTVQISDIFRSTFGDSQMMSRIRPVLEWQQGYNDLTARTLNFIDRWFNKHDSRSTVTNPHPVNYYIYGGSGSAYWDPGPVSGTLTIDNIWTMGRMNASVWENDVVLDANWAAAFGIKQLAYEGGAIDGDYGNAAVVRQANGDARMTNNFITHHKAWNHRDGDLLMYFNLSTGQQPGLGILQQIDNLTVPKYQAITTLKSMTPDTVTRGTVAPFSRAGASFDVLTWHSPNPGGTGNATLTANTSDFAAGYSFRAGNTGNYTVQIGYSTTMAATLVVELGGNVIGTYTLANTNGAAALTPTVPVSLEKNKLYSIRVVSTSGTVSIRTVNVNLVSQAIPAAVPTMPFRADVFPNPASGQVTLRLETTEAGIAKVQVTDMLNKMVLVKEHRLQQGKNILHLNLSSLTQGLYYITIQTGSTITVKPVMLKK
jgi:hypothetical protein